MAQEQPPNVPTTPESTTSSQPAEESHRIGFFPSLGIFLLEFIAPVILSSLFLYWLSGAVPLWSLNRVIALIVLALLLVVLSLILSFLIDLLTLPLRKKSPYKKFINPVGSRARLVKFILAGILIPGGVFAAANLYSLPQGKTPMNLVVHYSQLSANISPTGEIGDAVLGSTSPTTKIQGIKTLQAVHSPESLDQLFRILTTDPAALNDAGEYEALSSAIASFGTSAMPRLFNLNSNSDQIAYKPNLYSTQDVFNWYFSASFAELRKDIQAQNPDQASREAELANLASAETALQQTVATINMGHPGLSASSPVTDFIMQTFLAMNVQQDPELLQLAKTIASDSRNTDGARGAALLLIARSGGKGELSGLYAYLSENNEYIKSKALEAIASLQTGEPTAGSTK